MNAEMGYHNQVISDLGVSQRLGNSVLSELDYRANFKACNSISKIHNSGEHDEHRGRDRFQSTHRINFDTMDSIDDHYAAKKASTNDTTLQPNDPNSTDLNFKENVAVPATPKRESDGVTQNSSKRMRDLDGRRRDSDVFVHSPVSDITRRIRRLRVRNNSQTPRNNQAKINSVRNTPLNPINRPSFESHATFAKPTFTSISRETKPGAIFSKLKKPDNANKSVSSFRKGATTNQPTLSQPHPSPPVVAPSSVFRRLYEQSTVSRSNSSQTLSNAGATKGPAVPPKKTSTIRASQTMRNLRQEESPRKTTMSKSKSSYTLSAETRNSTNTRLPKSTSTTQVKPIWR
ncbi:She1p LALA0_S09e03334g [Lachancea lanzarotensis]|uniref:LALA0S09e03334g1_1 n=1 Tax=Lachancea lanzarotensis TaxID=1245769 RepID=A0A0C7NDQ1_9SACH|nr:uncharacterized protein LALA0_S09e03334g [Lachancea lanzarotensis]CEP63824.1 LALA0S09e03334g1_1 [Lachancea lanzarotensis]